MTDKSAQELGTHLVCGFAVYYEQWRFSVPYPLGAVGNIHPHCIRLVCDFHTFQAFERWVNFSQHSVSPEVRSIVKAAFKELVYAKSG